MDEHNAYLHQLLYLPQVWSAELSPDARWIAFEWYHRHENMDVFLAPADGSAPPIALTSTPELTTFCAWLPDSSAVIVSEDHDRDEHIRFFLVDLAQPGRMVSLTEDRPSYFMGGGAMSQDRRYLYYTANYDFEHNCLLEPAWLYRHDLQTGERQAIARPHDPVWGQMHLNQQGTHILYSRSDLHPAGFQVYLVDIEGKQDSELFNFGEQVKVYARWFPDGERILVLSENSGHRPQQHISLGVYSLPQERMHWLIDDPQRNIENAHVAPDGLIVVDEVIDGGHRPSFLDPQSGQEIPFTAVRGNLLPLRRSAAGEWVSVHYSSLSPRDLVRLDRTGSPQQGMQSLTGVWSLCELTPTDLTPARSVTWQAEDGTPIQSWLYAAQPNPRRAIIFVHGGPTFHQEDEVVPELQYFVRCGFNVLDVNYRGSTGFGFAFRESIKEDGWGGREQGDILAGARWLIENNLAQPGRIGVTGTSYGGYSSWYLITSAPVEQIAAAAPICGMTDLVVDYETTRPDLRRYSEEMMGGSPQEVPQIYLDRSPINFIQNLRGRLLIVQGAVDPNVTPENVFQVEKRLKEHAIAYDKLIFEDEGHGILKTANQELLYRRLAAFFDAL